MHKYGKRLFNSTIVFLFPSLRVPPIWADKWRNRDREAFVRGARLLNGLGAFVYLLHLLVIDEVYGLKPPLDWAMLRAAGIAVNLFAFGCTFNRAWMQGPIYWMPLSVAGIACTYLQNISFYWFAGTPYLFSIIIPAIVTLCLRLGIPASTIYLLSCYTVAFPAWKMRPEAYADILSFAAVTLMCVVVLRSRSRLEIAAFISEQERLEAQRRVIEKEIELNDQVRTFLPREIYRRFRKMVDGGRSPRDAMQEILNARPRNVVCLYTDIRSFTQRTKASQKFVAELAMPNIRAGTDAVQHYRGIPKIVGDLLFAYFDGRPEQDILRALAAATVLLRQTDEQNQQFPEDQKLRRFVCISAGSGIVGNIGGSDGAQDINVLGTPANILSRVDPLTKQKLLVQKMNGARILLTAEAAALLRKAAPTVTIETVNLAKLRLKVRDFEEVKLISFVAMNEAQLHTLLDKLLKKPKRKAASTPSVPMDEVREAA